jgi:hypothetical protein
VLAHLADAGEAQVLEQIDGRAEQEARVGLPALGALDLVAHEGGGVVEAISEVTKSLS